jgi:hypothetical protein
MRTAQTPQFIMPHSAFIIHEETMYCPKCGQNSPEGQKFCKFCGTNLSLVSQTLLHGTTPGKGLPETWAKIIDDWFGERPEPPPEEKRLKDIRGGVVTTFTGIGICVFSYFFFGAVASSPAVPPDAAVIVQKIWLAGLVPLFVGLGLLINGLFLHRRPGQSVSQIPRQPARVAAPETQRVLSEPGVVIPPSVTEQTTHRLEPPNPVPLERQRQGE